MTSHEARHIIPASLTLTRSAGICSIYGGAMKRILIILGTIFLGSAVTCANVWGQATAQISGYCQGPKRCCTARCRSHGDANRYGHHSKHGYERDRLIRSCRIWHWGRTDWKPVYRDSGPSFKRESCCRSTAAPSSTLRLKLARSARPLKSRRMRSLSKRATSVSRKPWRTSESLNCR